MNFFCLQVYGPITMGIISGRGGGVAYIRGAYDRMYFIVYRYMGL